LDAAGDPLVDGAGPDHQIGMAGADTEDHSESVVVVMGSSRSDHLIRATGDTADQVQQRGLAAHVDWPTQIGAHNAWHDFAVAETHFRTTLFQAYTNPANCMKRKMNMRTKVYRPRSRRTTAQGYRKMVSTSKITNSRANM